MIEKLLDKSIRKSLPEKSLVDWVQSFKQYLKKFIFNRDLQATIQNRVKELNSVVTIQIGAEATLRAWVSDCVFAPSG